MEYDKQHLEKLLLLVEEIYKDPANKEFYAGINALSLSSEKGKVKLPMYPAEKLDDIYEYCLSKKLTSQANGFYHDFPMLDIKAELINDFVQMEEYKRRDNFANFCIMLFRQIEAIVNSICLDPAFDSMIHRMYSKILFQSYTLEDFVYGNQKAEQSSKALSEQYITFKFAMVNIFVVMGYSGNKFDTQSYKEYKNLFYELSQVRNMIHGAGKSTPVQSQIRESVINEKDVYYLRFLTLLSNFVSKIKSNYPLSAESYSLTP